jgi:SAM-dependent methyltransferase
MATWMSGYVADVVYTLGFYREMAPTFLNMTCILNQVDAVPLTRATRYCELGCGRGYGTLLLAAANPNTEFVGVDFNPSHIAEARGLAARAAIPNISFVEMSFDEAARSNDPNLANFDIVALHGVYTWVDPTVRADIHQFIRVKLLAGGVVYNSYNVLPGWAAALPIQHLLMEVANRSSRDSLATIKEGFALLNSLFEKGSAFFTQSPGVKARIDAMSRQDPAYLVHEFLNKGWQPLFVTDVMANFSDAKLTYIGSATLPENQLDLCVQRDLQPIVNAAPDVAMRELLKDYATNKQFRRDVYVKGPRILPQRELRLRFENLILARTFQSKALPEKFAVSIGAITPSRQAMTTFMEAIAETPVTCGELISRVAKNGMGEADVVLLLLLSVNEGIVSPVRPDHASVPRGACDRLNKLIFDLAVSADSHQFIASPVLGSAIPATYLDRLIAPLVLVNPAASDLEISRMAFDRLDAVGQSFRRDGQVLPKNDENVQSLAPSVGEFRQFRLPRWRALAIVGA